MNKYREIKKTLNNKEVVQKFLGLPEKCTSSGNWYKSPFRKEKTASFCVSEKGIHDFGDGEHYDLISFVQKYFNTTPPKALEIICKEFGITDIGNEYETPEILERIKRKRQEEKKAEQYVNAWFNSKMQKICDEIQINESCICICSKVPNFEVLSILYAEQVRLENDFETLFNATEDEKIKIYLEAQNDKRRKNENTWEYNSTRIIL